MTESEEAFARRAVRRKGLFLKLSVASLIVAAGLVVLYLDLLVAGPQLPCRAAGGHHSAHPPQRPTEPPSVQVRGCA